MKIITPLILSILLLGGCSSQPRIIDHYINVNVPVPTVPAPAEVNKPNPLAINGLSIDQKTDDGEIAKAYVITIQQLLDYVKELETVYNKYLDLSKQNTPVSTTP